MTLGALAPLIGGIGLFLLGMMMITDGLRIAAGDALQAMLDQWTHTGFRAFMAGLIITAIVQSSTVTTVATVGFANAGLLNLLQAIWVVVGSNVAAAITGWLVALVGISADATILALPMLGIGMMVRIAMRRQVQRAGLGEALAGFGLFFLGIDVLQGAFAGISPLIATMELDQLGWLGLGLAVVLGVVLTLVTQASSASIAIILTSATTGSVPLDLAACAVIGSGIGTTSTAVFMAIDGTPEARRVAMAHVLFNVLAAVVSLAALSPLLLASAQLNNALGLPDDMAILLAMFHTLQKLAGVAVFYVLRMPLERFLGGLFISPSETLAKPKYLDANILPVPSLAVRGLTLEVARLAQAGLGLARQCTHSVIWQDKAACPRGTTQEDALRQLADEIRQFVSRLGASVLPDPVATGLPSIIRATQHMDELMQASHEICDNRAGRPDLPDHNWHELEDAVMACLAALPDDGEQLPDLHLLDEKAHRLHDAYEAVKTQLLASAAAGRLAVDTMNRGLMLARAMRRCARLAIKAKRRLLLSTVGHDEEPEWPDAE